jgi:hypothetical protein
MPRPKRGEMAPGVKRIQASREESARRRFDLLRDTLSRRDQSPSTILIKAFASQQSLATWASAEQGVHPMAVNTLRRYISTLYPGGAPAFERDRLALMRRLGERPAKEGTKDALQRGNHQLQEANQSLVNSVLEFSAQYLDLLKRTTELAKNHASVADELDGHLRAFPHAYRGLRVVPGGRRD